VIRISGIKDVEQKILTLVQQKKKARISWVASIVLLTEGEVTEIASSLKIKIEGEYLIAPQTKEVDSKKSLTKEEYDQLNPKPAPTFCEAQGSKYSKH